MKQKDIVLIVLIALISAVFSLILSNLLFAAPEKRQQEVEIVDPITADFEQPGRAYFNENSVNPTKLIQIGDNPNPQPFNVQ